MNMLVHNFSPATKEFKGVLKFPNFLNMLFRYNFSLKSGIYFILGESGGSIPSCTPGNIAAQVL